MFHTLFDYKDEIIPNNRQFQKSKSKVDIKTSFTDKRLSENFYGSGNQVYDLYNNDENYNYNNYNANSGDNNTKFEKTRNKVKLIVYKNGFILNNGPFRDLSIPENEEFLEQVERGIIPHELLDKGISDLGILLINRKAEIYQDININYFNNYDYNNYQQKKSKIPHSKPINNIPFDKSRMTNKNIQKIHKKKDKKKRQNCSEPKNNEKKSFIPFSGSGKLIRNVSTQGLHINKNLKNNIDIYQPVCTFNVRLYNGEVVKCEFNYTQTLRDIYYHVKRLSGSSNFYLLDGFPPRALRDYDRPIYELGIQNSLLTQKIN